MCDKRWIGVVITRIGQRGNEYVFVAICWVFPGLFAKVGWYTEEQNVATRFRPVAASGQLKMQIRNGLVLPVKIYP